MGTTGLETAFASLYTDLVLPGTLPLALVVERLTAGAALLDLPTPSIAAGGPRTSAWSTSRRVGGRRGRLREPVGELLLRRADPLGRVLVTLAAGAVAYRERAFALSAA